MNQYLAILNLVATIDHHLERSTRHFHNHSGRLLVTLDQVVHAILSNDLSIPPPVPPSGGLGGILGGLLQPLQNPYRNPTEAALDDGWPMFPEEV